MADEYDAHYRGAHESVENRALQRLLQPRGRVLDLGCGTGQALELFQLAPDEYEGIDISGRMLAVAKAKFPEHCFNLLDMERLNGAHRADTVLSLFSLNYSLSPECVMAGIWRALRPGGQVAILAYGPHHPRRPGMYLLQERGIEAPRLMLTARELRALCSRWFVDVTIRGFNIVLDTLPAGLARLLPGWLFALEARTLGQLAPDAGTYLLVTARRG